MLPDKITIKLTLDEANALCGVLEIYLQDITKPRLRTMKEKMYLVLLSEVYKKLNFKFMFFKKVNLSFSFTTPQAIAFWFVFSDEFLIDEFTNNLIQTICRQVHQKVA